MSLFSCGISFFFSFFWDIQILSVTRATSWPQPVGRSPLSLFFSFSFKFWEPFGVQFLSPPQGGGGLPHTAGLRCSFKGWLPCFSSRSAHPYFSLLPRCFKVMFFVVVRQIPVWFTQPDSQTVPKPLALEALRNCGTDEGAVTMTELFCVFFYTRSCFFQLSAPMGEHAHNCSLGLGLGLCSSSIYGAKTKI